MTTNLGLSPYGTVFKQKQRKPCSQQTPQEPHKNIVNPTKIHFVVHAHDEDHFHQLQILKLASGTHTG